MTDVEQQWVGSDQHGDSRRGAATAADYLPLSVLPRVTLELEATWNHKGDNEMAGNYTITGPAKVLKVLQRYDINLLAVTGTISPRSKVTVESAHRASAGIPVDAIFYSYIHPVASKLRDQLGAISLSRNKWANVLLVGGYVYFDEALQPIAVNALTLAPSDTGLMMVGRELDDIDSARLLQDAMERTGRLDHDLLEPVRSAGWSAFGWVHADETFDGRLLDTTPRYNDGGFVYVREAATGLSQVFMYVLVSPASPNYENWLKESRALRSNEGSLAAAYKDAIERAENAQKVRRSAGSAAHIGAAKKSTVSFTARLKRLFICALVLLVYIIFGLCAYSVAVTDDDQWSYIQAFYFSVVTMSTVGYGDITPTGTPLKVFTAMYILVGVAVVFSHAGELYDALIDGIYGCAVAMLRMLSVKGSSQASGSTTWFVDVEPGWMYFSKAIVPSLVVGLGFSVFFAAWVFTLTEPDLSYSNAVWHCWVTATTVGYGDVTLSTDLSLLWAAVHILIAVSWLASLLSVVNNARTQRRYDLQRAAALQAQLSEDLIEQLNLDRKTDGVSQLEFVVGMIITLGAEVCGEKLDFEKHIRPLMDRFDTLDEDNSKLLTHEDLAFMVEETKNAHPR